MLRAFFFVALISLSCSSQPATSVNPAQTAVAQAVAAQPAAKEAALTAAEFAQIIERVSEANGYFDTDNLISNESSYLHVMGKLRKLNVTGGAYIGVGPDQNFSYIAQIRPTIVFVSDIRRDNLLQHLFFKSLFSLAHNRVEFLCLLFGKPMPGEVSKLSIDEVVQLLEKAPADFVLGRQLLIAAHQNLIVIKVLHHRISNGVAGIRRGNEVVRNLLENRVEARQRDLVARIDPSAGRIVQSLAR